MSSEKAHHEAEVDKNFLKRNEFVDAVVRGKSFVETYKGPILLLAIVALALLIGIPTFNYYRHSRSVALGKRIFEADKGLKKEAAYQEILRDFAGNPAVRVAHLELAEQHVSHDEFDKAHAVLDQGLSQTHNDILSTLLVLKKIDLLRLEKKPEQAAEFASKNLNKVLSAYQGRLKLMEAELWLSAGKADKAKAVYDDVASSPVATSDEGVTSSGYDAAVINEAKENRLLIELGLL